ncbi:MAG: transposase, partial [Rubrobacter sp.]
YAALDRGQIDTEALRKLLSCHPLAGTEGETPVYAVDASVWARSDAECSPARGYYYHPSRHSAGQPIVAGWAYQWIAQLGFARESWTAPVDLRRVRPEEDANAVAAEQVKALLGRLGKQGAAPLFVFDAGYDPVKMQRTLEGSPCQILLRLRAGRRFYGDPGLCDPPENIGRPRRHGPKMKCNDPSTWPEPSAEHACEDAGYGSVRVRAWAEMHPKVHNHAGKGTRGPLPIVVGTLILVEVERLPRGARGGASLGFCGCGGMDRRGRRRTWVSSGAPTSGASIWSTPSASSSKAWGVRRRGCATPSRPTGGVGWWWPPTRS